MQEKEEIKIMSIVKCADCGREFSVDLEDPNEQCKCGGKNFIPSDCI